MARGGKRLGGGKPKGSKYTNRHYQLGKRITLEEKEVLENILKSFREAKEYT